MGFNSYSFRTHPAIDFLCSDLNLQVQKAEVNTVGNTLVSDTFYVVNAFGNRLSDAEIATTIERLEGLQTKVIAGSAIRPVGFESGTENLDKDEAGRMELIHRLKDLYIRNDVLSVQESIINHVEYTIGRSRYKFESSEAYHVSICPSGLVTKERACSTNNDALKGQARTILKYRK